MVTQHQLQGYLGKSISQICQNGFASDHDNHCAHFVSHVLGYRFGLTCQMMGNGKVPGFNLRVQEIFPKCPSVGVWSLRPARLTTCLVFITKASSVNLTTKVIANVPRKHIGIYLGGFVWHYSNRDHKVVRETSSQFSHHYPTPHNAMFYGAMP
jgi:hypothetical protein